MNKLPRYIVSALRKGLELHSQGLSGKGLVAKTVSDARRGVSSGEWSDEKVKRASAWLARHRFDRSRMKQPSKWDDPPKYSPAYVAWLLWGDGGDGRGRSWLDKKADKIKAQEEAPQGPASTPAPPKDRIKGGRNTGRAGTSGRGIKLSKSTVAGLEKKLKAHNSDHGEDPSRRATLSMLKKVYLRGSGAFSTSHRPQITSRAQWAMARVNAFLYLLKNHKPKRSKYITDNDLLPKEHPRSTKMKNEGVVNPSADQRQNLPSEAYSPCDFRNEDGEFLSSKSKLPHHTNDVDDPNDHSSVDLPRLRNALARFGQTDFSQFPPGTSKRARAHLERHADALLKSRQYECEKDPQLVKILGELEKDLIDFRDGHYHKIAKRINDEA